MTVVTGRGQAVPSPAILAWSPEGFHACGRAMSSSFPLSQLTPTVPWGGLPDRWALLRGFQSLPIKAALWRNGLTSLDSSLWVVPAHPHTVLSSPLEPYPAQSAQPCPARRSPASPLSPALGLCLYPTRNVCAHACGKALVNLSEALSAHVYLMSACAHMHGLMFLCMQCLHLHLSGCI